MLSSKPSVSYTLFAVVTSKITDRLSHNKCSNSENVWNIARIIKM